MRFRKVDGKKNSHTWYYGKWHVYNSKLALLLLRLYRGRWSDSDESKFVFCFFLKNPAPGCFCVLFVFGTSLLIGSKPASSIIIEVCQKWILLQPDFLIAQVMLAHQAPVIHPVIYFLAIPDTINTVSEQAPHFSSETRLCSLGKWWGFVML